MCLETKALLPHWVIMEAGSVALKLRSEQATCCFFCDLSGLLAAVVKACAEPGAFLSLLSQPAPSLKYHIRGIWVPSYLLIYCCAAHSLSCVLCTIGLSAVYHRPANQHRCRYCAGFQECMGSLLESAQAEMGYPVSVGGLEQACRSAAVSTLFYKVTKFADYSGVFCVSGAIGRCSSVLQAHTVLAAH